jgi:hypothetical protein
MFKEKLTKTMLLIIALLSFTHAGDTYFFYQEKRNTIDYKLLNKREKPKAPSISESLMDGMKHVCFTQAYSSEYTETQTTKVCVYANGYTLRWGANRKCPRGVSMSTTRICEIIK